MCSQLHTLHFQCPCRKTTFKPCDVLEHLEEHAHSHFEQGPNYRDCKDLKTETTWIEGCCEMAEGGGCPHEKVEYDHKFPESSFMDFMYLLG
jgi:hypothetical protein